jgi:hypothetical protein
MKYSTSIEIEHCRRQSAFFEEELDLMIAVAWRDLCLKIKTNCKILIHHRVSVLRSLSRIQSEGIEFDFFKGFPSAAYCQKLEESQSLTIVIGLETDER